MFNDEQIIPSIRENISVEIINENGEKLILLTDPDGYALQQLAMPIEFMPLLHFLDGTRTKKELTVQLKSDYGDKFEIEPIFSIYTHLNLLGYLDSDRFKEIKADLDNYMESPFRPPICAGSSYPAVPAELNDYLKSMFELNGKNENTEQISAMILPHIDFRVGENARAIYAAGYNEINNTEADLFVILGTAHNGLSSQFMLTEKDFLTPLGFVKTDVEIVREILKTCPETAGLDEIIHRDEHSIEFQTVLLKYILKNKPFTIVPILAGSIHNFILNKQNPSSSSLFDIFTKSLSKIISKTGRKAVFIASADLAHIGRRFDDNFDAESELEKLHNEDMSLVKNLENCDYEKFFTDIADVKDARKICGLSPIYTLMHTVKPKTGKIINYTQWNDRETGSAVSFAGLTFY